ncbi:MAG: N-acyl homoserine lactonase family protein [Saprospiraceae bacterium]|nr:N-acyl homoserine lactonase family protein [Saprospiraceae bacterium]
MNQKDEIISVQVGGIKVHAITSGLVKVKRTHKNPSIGFPAILLDPFWTDWLPIHTWLIEHPEGNILIDTGENSQVNDKGYFSCDTVNGAVYRTILKFDIDQDRELPALLSKINIQPDDIRWVILTHLHLDHVDGIHFFPKAEFVVAKNEFRITSPGHVPCLLPSWFAPRTVTFSTKDNLGFDGSYALTQAKDVMIVPTPGHTYGHQSVILQTNEQAVFFAGDTTFTQKQLLKTKVAGICVDKKAARKTIQQIQSFGKNNSMIYLPSHDLESVKRLKNLEVYPS